MKELLERAHLGEDHGYLRQVSYRLFLSGVRRLKEQLFTSGVLQHRIVNTDVSITLEEFLKSEGVVKFTEELDGTVQGFLDRVHKSWVTPLESAKLVLTGGGCELPMVKGLKKKGWAFNGQTLHFELAKSVPDEVRDKFPLDLIREYPSLAVALGGSLPTVLREDSTLDEWPGGTPSPGSLTRYQTTGI